MAQCSHDALSVVSRTFIEEQHLVIAAGHVHQVDAKGRRAEQRGGIARDVGAIPAERQHLELRRGGPVGVLVESAPEGLLDDVAELLRASVPEVALA